MRIKISTIFLAAMLLAYNAGAAEPQTAPPKPPAMDEGSKSLILDILGLTPEEIEFLKDEKMQRNESADPVIEAQSITRTITMDLSPGAKAQTVRVNSRHGASLVFTDSTGAAWPIQGINNFAGDYFETVIPVEGGSVVTVSAKKDFRKGNIAIFLEGLTTPIVLDLMSGQPEIDERIDLSIPRRGPNAQSIAVESVSLPAYDRFLADVLAGIPPAGSKSLEVFQNGEEKAIGSIKAWQLNGKLYLRSPYSIMSPAPSQYQGSADGMKGYVLEITPVVLFVDKGKVYQMRIAI